MTVRFLVAAMLAGASSIALAAPPAYLMVDQSSAALMDKAAAQAAWQAEMPAKLTKRLFKLYPTGRWGFITQVEGGFTQAKACVVTARVMLVPRAGKVLQFVPNKAATAFDSLPNATQDQCRDLAKAKLDEAITAVLSSLVKT